MKSQFFLFFALLLVLHSCKPNQFHRRTTDFEVYEKLAFPINTKAVALKKFQDGCYLFKLYQKDTIIDGASFSKWYSSAPPIDQLPSDSQSTFLVFLDDYRVIYYGRLDIETSKDKTSGFIRGYRDKKDTIGIDYSENIEIFINDALDKDNISLRGYYDIVTRKVRQANGAVDHLTIIELELERANSKDVPSNIVNIELLYQSDTTLQLYALKGVDYYGKLNTEGNTRTLYPSESFLQVPSYKFEHRPISLYWMHDDATSTAIRTINFAPAIIENGRLGNGLSNARIIYNSSLPSEFEEFPVESTW